MKKTLADHVNAMTQIERDHLIEWFRVNRPDALRNAMRALGFIRVNRMDSLADRGSEHGNQT